MSCLKLISLIICSLVMLYTAPVRAVVINFDDITTDPNGAEVPMNYYGLEWGSGTWFLQSDLVYKGALDFMNSYGSPSGNYAAYNANGAMIVQLASGADFDFTGAYFSTFAFNDDFFSGSAINIEITGWNNYTPVRTISMPLQATQYDWLQADMLGVDQLIFRSGSTNGKFFLMDDLTINESTPVPEPATMILLGSGLVGVGFFRFRKKLKN